MSDTMFPKREERVPYGGGKPVRKVAVGGGACAGFMQQAVSAGCDTFVTADVRYNQFWDARDLGMTIIDAGHFKSEDIVISPLIKHLSTEFPNIIFTKSKAYSDKIKFA